MAHAEYFTGTSKTGQEQQDNCHQLEEFFETSPVGFNVIASDGTILRANKAELELLGYAAEEYIGHQLAEFHADHHAPGDMLDRLARGQKLDRYPAQIRAKDQSIKYVQISSNAQFRDGHFLGARCLTIDVTQAAIAEQRIHERERESQRLLNAIPAAIYVTDAEGKVTFCNKAAADLVGRRPEIDQDKWCVTWRLYSPDGTPVPLDACPMARSLRENRPIRGIELIAERPDGTRVPVLPFPTPLRDETGKVVGAVNMLVDMSERKEAERTREVLIGELNHRVKNTLATIQAIAQQTLRHTPDPNQFVAGFTGRIQALAHVHTLLAANEWTGMELSTLMRLQIGASRSAQVGWSGPHVFLQPQVALHLAIMLYELVSNARKFGALSAPDGHLQIRWSVESRDERVLHIEWTEGGGRFTPRSGNRGFGSILIEQIAGASGGGARAVLDDHGINWHIWLPLPAIPASRAARGGNARSADGSRADRSILAGKRILIIEDEPLIALELSQILLDAGMEVAGIAQTIVQARLAMETLKSSAVMLDANLDGQKVDDLAVTLSRENVPFVFVSGYDRDNLPAAFRNRPHVLKPFTSRQVLDTLAAALSQTESRSAEAR